MSITTDDYDASFDGAAFWEQSPAGYYAGIGGAETFAEYHIPGGDETIIIRTGKAASRVEVRAAALTADIEALYGKRGAIGSLVFHGGTVDAFLYDVTDRRRAGALGVEEVTLRFILT